MTNTLKALKDIQNLEQSKKVFNMRHTKLHLVTSNIVQQRLKYETKASAESVHVKMLLMY